MEIEFKLTYVLPDSKDVKTVFFDKNTIEQFGVISYYVFKTHFKNGNIDVWVQGTEINKDGCLFQIDWIQVKHDSKGNFENKIEIGRIDGPKYVKSHTQTVDHGKEIAHIYDRLLYVHSNIHIDVTYFCVNDAFTTKGFFIIIDYGQPCNIVYKYTPYPWVNLPILMKTNKKPYTVEPKRSYPKANISTVNNSYEIEAEKPVIEIYEGLLLEPVKVDYKAIEQIISNRESTKYKKSNTGKIVGSIFGVLITITAVSICCYIVYRKKFANRNDSST